MRKLLLLSAVGILCVPALANADIYNRTKLGFTKADRSLRSLIVKKLNADRTGSGGMKYTTAAQGLRGTKSIHVGPGATFTSVEFTAQPRVKINGSWGYLGGCSGTCVIKKGTAANAKPKITDWHITGLLRELAPH